MTDTRPVVLKAEHLGITFGGLKAVDDFNLMIGRTEIAGLIGPNGAGKSTLFSTEAEDNLGIRLNSDEILHSLGLDWADSNAQILAGKQLLRLQKDCLEKGLSFNQETTLSGITILRTISQAKELGYSIHLRYVGVESPEIAKERVRKRIELGGHGVTGETIERRFIKSP